jgi:hypothetical protein
MNVLLNGCSFMNNYYYKQHFNKLLSANTVNIARPGSCNRRIIRTTVEYIEKNPVDLVVLGLTFYDRQESPLLTNKTDPWVSYNSQGMQAIFANADDFGSTVEHKEVDDYVKSRYRYDINNHYLKSLYLDLKMFCAYLRERAIQYCIINMCDKHHKNWPVDPGIIPLDFVANEYLEANGSLCMEQDKDLPANARHHYGEDVIILVEHLIKYVNGL